MQTPPIAGPSTTPIAAAAPPATTDTLTVPAPTLQDASDRPQGATHGREASGRSVLSNLSSRLAAIRERERSDDYAVALNRLQLARQIQDIEAAVNAEAAATAAATNSAGVTASGSKKDNVKARKEREEASALVGPSLAHYFGSGSSSSGAVTGAASNATNPVTQATPAAGDSAQPPASSSTVPNGATNSPTTPGPLPETPGGFGSFARRARLGSRGRARGASLSGLSNAFALSEPPNESPSAFHTALPSSPGGTGAGEQLNLEALTEAVAMAEGIDIEVLKQWIDRSLDDAGAVEIDGVAEEAAEKAMQAQSYCTTLQSLVNLKRNTIHLMAASTDLGVRATSTALSPVGENSAAEEGNQEHPLSPTTGADSSAPVSATTATIPTAVVQESSLRPARSLSTMPIFGNSMGLQAGVHGKVTHQLHFEYDCSSPNASVQVFLRASRKHGSWQSWIQKREEQGKPANADGAEESLWFTRGPPPHVLGWPVHSSQVRKGFAQPVKASLTLQLGLYAPPTQRASASEQVAEAAAPSSPKETTEAAATAPASAPAEARGIEEENALTRIPTLPPIPADETKEQRTAREKLERETLKLAVVVEALDANGQPYPEPNLQTTYLRLTSLPIRAPQSAVAPDVDAVGAESPPTSTPSPAPATRLWTVHVEGQEAEIGSHRFQLQELYGLSSRPPPIKVEASAEGVAAGGAGGGGETADEAGGVVIDMDNMSNVGSECLICLSSPTNTLLLPCTHGLCLDCSIQLKESVKAQRDQERRRGKVPKKKYNCPMCRRAFTSMLHLKAVDPPAVVNDGEQTDDATNTAHHTRSSSLAKERLNEDDDDEDSRFVIDSSDDREGERGSGVVQHPL